MIARRVVVACLLSWSFLNTTPARPAVIASTESEDGSIAINFNGEIVPGDAKKLKALIETATNAGRSLSPIRLNSLGGAFGESERIAELIKNQGMATSVPYGARCASGCVIMLAAGTKKLVSYGAWVGVHRGAEGGVDTQWARRGNELMADIMRRLAVPQSIIDRMLATPHNRVAWLSADELESFGATMIGEPFQTPLPLKLPTAASVLDGRVDRVGKWEGLVEEAARLSSQQNGGNGPKTARRCNPDTRTCTSAIFYINRNDVPSMLETTFGPTGEVTNRTVCDFDEVSDAQSCANWRE